MTCKKDIDEIILVLKKHNDAIQLLDKDLTGVKNAIFQIQIHLEKIS